MSLQTSAHVCTKIATIRQRRQRVDTRRTPVGHAHTDVMKIQYLEIVTESPESVDGVCAAYSAAHGVEFSDPEPGLGGARTAPLGDGGKIGVRGPLSDAETPIVRPYALVDDAAAAVDAAVAAGSTLLHEPLELPGHGTFAIVKTGGVEHGFWQM